MNKTRYIFIALFAALIMIDVITMLFPTVRVADSVPAFMNDDAGRDSYYSVISMLGSGSNDDQFNALFYLTVLLGPILALIVTGTMKSPMKTVWKVLFIIYLLLNLFHSFCVFVIMILEIWGPTKYLTFAGWIPIGVNVLSAIFLFVLAVSKGMARGVLKGGRATN